MYDTDNSHMRVFYLVSNQSSDRHLYILVRVLMLEYILGTGVAHRLTDLRQIRKMDILSFCLNISKD